MRGSHGVTKLFDKIGPERRRAGLVDVERLLEARLSAARLGGA